MRTLLTLIFGIAILMGCVTTNTNPHQIDEQATAQAPWNVGEVIKQIELHREVEIGRGFYFVKFLGVTTQGNYLVQDFYPDSGAKRTDPFVIACTLREKSNGDSLLENCKPVAVIITRYRNGQKESEGHFQDGKVHGLVTRWRENGQKSSETSFQNGKAQGLLTMWHDNGQKWFEHSIQDDKTQGLLTIWYDNGQKHFETPYQDGQEQGISTSWHENGRKRFEISFQNGKMHGLGTYWNEHGVKLAEVWFENGVEVRKQMY